MSWSIKNTTVTSYFYSGIDSEFFIILCHLLNQLALRWITTLQTLIWSKQVFKNHVGKNVGMKGNLQLILLPYCDIFPFYQWLKEVKIACWLYCKKWALHTGTEAELNVNGCSASSNEHITGWPSYDILIKDHNIL